eukprot:TRINITY_DN9267_c0_g1_i1.p1 TRINITY_DN9267_c0_g1~~TRINITY_DN9267_c0_g1_i1.p1  ORF type:complete len:780 (-),score=236.20 TRINITY_DN9267_c0_g1_i1:68-2407(-)
MNTTSNKSSSRKKNKILQAKVTFLMSESSKWKDRVYQQRVAFESELRRRSKLIESMRRRLLEGGISDEFSMTTGSDDRAEADLKTLAVIGSASDIVDEDIQEQWAQRIDQFQEKLERRSKDLDDVMTQMLRFEEELKPFDESSHRQLEVLRDDHIRSLRDMEAMQKHFQGEVENVLGKVGAQLDSLEKFHARLRLRLGVVVPSIREKGMQTEGYGIEDEEFEHAKWEEEKIALTEKIEQLEQENAYLQRQDTSHQSYGKDAVADSEDEKPGYDEDGPVQVLRVRMQNLEKQLEEQRMKTDSALSEVTKWRDISMLTLPLMELLNRGGGGGEGSVQGALPKPLSPLLRSQWVPMMSHHAATMGSPGDVVAHASPIVSKTPAREQHSLSPDDADLSEKNASLDSPSKLHDSMGAGTDYTETEGEVPDSSSVKESPRMSGILAMLGGTPDGGGSTFESPWDGLKESRPFLSSFLTMEPREFVFGGKGPGHVDGYARRAQFNTPFGIVSTRQGSQLIISDLGNKCIRRINIEDGLVVTISSISSASKKTSIQYPTGVALDTDEKHILVADSKRNSVLRVNARSGATLHLASLPLVHGQRSQIHDIIVDDGGFLFVTHTRGISKIHPKSRTVSHVASSYHTGWVDGAFEVAQFKNPHGLCFLSSSEILVADTENHVIRHLDLKNMLVSTYAGCGENGSEDGPSRSAKFSFPKKITVDVMRALVFVTERGEHVRIIDMNTRTVSTLRSVSFHTPVGIRWISQKKMLVVAECRRHAVRLLQFPDLE